MLPDRPRPRRARWHAHAGARPRVGLRGARHDARWRGDHPNGMDNNENTLSTIKMASSSIIIITGIYSDRLIIVVAS